MRLRRTRRDARPRRSWSRRLIDDEARDLLDELDESRDVYRTSSGDFQLATLARDVFATAGTTDLRWLKSRGVDGDDFYRRELAPSWEGLAREQREQRIERFVELSNMLGGAVNGGEPDPELLDLVATVHVKVLLLAFAFDRTYGFVDRLLNGPLQYREHLRRNRDYP